MGFPRFYPVTAQPMFRVKATDLMRIHRSYYEGTKYDLTRGLAAGPWGDPDRWNYGLHCW